MSTAYRTDVSQDTDTLQRDGIVGHPQAFDREWVHRLGEDIETAFQEARSRPDGLVGRGPNRYYAEIHPEQLRGAIDLLTHRWILAMCEAVLGADYQFVEVGFDVPLAGAVNQPWHRDFPSPPETREHRRLTSLAFNITTVDVTPDMGPFEIAPGTQWDDEPDFMHGMFPPKSCYDRYEGLARRSLTRMGDLSCRSALTIHRGTANRSDRSRPTLVLGVDAPGAGNLDRHDPAMSRRFADSLPGSVHDHLPGRVVDVLEPVVQQHTIEGLVMGEV